MGRAGVLQGLRTMKFEAVCRRWQRQELSQEEAAEILGVTERTFRRWHRRYEEEGVDGLQDRRLGKPSPRRVPEGWEDRVEQLYGERYVGFNARHFWEHLVKDHGFPFSYSWAKSFLHRRQLIALKARTGVHRQRRPRRPMIGMMLHQDGSRHRWLGEQQGALDLIVTMDDADRRIYSAFLVEEEGTMSSLRALREVIGEHGLFCALYTDRGSHYFETPQAGGKVSREHLTQVGRALGQLGIEHIAAYSPEARGRSERMFGTLQDRLPKELRLAGITTPAAANRFIAEAYLPAHNARFAVPPQEAGSAFVADQAGAWRDILCVQEERVVGNDNTVRFEGLRLQLPQSPLRAHFVRARVRVHRYPDDTLAVFHGPRCLARYRADGRLLEPSKLRGAQAASAPKSPVDMWTIRVPRTGCASPVSPTGTRGNARLRPHDHSANRRKAKERSGQLTCHEHRTS
jgi:transposase